MRCTSIYSQYAHTNLVQLEAINVAYKLGGDKLLVIFPQVLSQPSTHSSAHPLIRQIHFFFYCQFNKEGSATERGEMICFVTKSRANIKLMPPTTIKAMPR